MSNSRDAYIAHKLESVPGPQRYILEALQTLGYKLIPISADEDNDPSWIVMHKGAGARSVQVKQKDINSRWMLHVTIEDIHEVEKYAVDQMWGVVDLYRSLALDDNRTADVS